MFNHKGSVPSTKPTEKRISYELGLRKFSKDIQQSSGKKYFQYWIKAIFIEYNLFCVIKFIYATTTENYFEKGLACNINSLKLKFLPGSNFFLEGLFKVNDKYYKY